MEYKNYFLMLICFILAGCGNPSRKELSKILEQTESLAILSAPYGCEPHFYPSSEFSWDRVWEGMSEGGSSAIADVKESYNYLGPILGGILFFIRVPVAVVAGGASNAYQMPNELKSHFGANLRNSLEDRNPGEQVARRIHTNCKEKNPELHSLRIYWNDREDAAYRIASSQDKKAKNQGFCRTLDSSGMQMLLEIHGTDYGLAGGTTKDPVSCFFMNIQADLIRSKDGKRIYSREFEYKSASHGLNEWETDGGKLLKDQFNQACFDLGDRVSSEMLGLEEISSK